MSFFWLENNLLEQSGTIFAILSSLFHLSIVSCQSLSILFFPLSISLSYAQSSFFGWRENLELISFLSLLLTMLRKYFWQCSEDYMWCQELSQGRSHEMKALFVAHQPSFNVKLFLLLKIVFLTFLCSVDIDISI